MRWFLLVCGIVFSGLYFWSETEAPVFGGERAEVQALKPGLRVANVGNSHAGSFPIEKVHPHAKRLNFGFQDVAELSYGLTYLDEVFRELDTLFIAIPPYFFLFDNGAMDDDYLTQFRFRAYHVYPRRRPIHNNWNDFLISQVLPLARFDHWAGIFKPKLLDVGLFRRWEGSTGVPEGDSIWVNKHALTRSAQNERFVHTMLEHNPDLEKQTEADFRSILSRANHYGIKVILYRPPYYFRFSEELNASIQTRNDGQLRKILRDFDVPFFDFQRDSAFAFNHQFFRDSDHLTDTTAVQFANFFLNRLRTSRYE